MAGTVKSALNRETRARTPLKLEQARTATILNPETSKTPMP